MELSTVNVYLCTCFLYKTRLPGYCAYSAVPGYAYLESVIVLLGHAYGAQYCKGVPVLVLFAQNWPTAL